ncbi:MAG: hypothetical protein WCD27_15975, partial [Candidatus Acidiferrales bacterium]
MGEGPRHDRTNSRAISRRRFLSETTGTAASLALLVPGRTVAGQSARPKADSGAASTRLSVDAAQVVTTFDPDECLGSSMDIQSRESIEKIYTPEVIKVCLSAGWGPISYRFHPTETVDYWHWNPNGRWSDEANQRGYFVGSSELGE